MNAIGQLGQLIINLQSPIEILLLIALVAIVAVWLFKRLRGGGKQTKMLEEINAKVSIDGRQEQILEEINAKIAELDNKVNLIQGKAYTDGTMGNEIPGNEALMKAVPSSEPALEESQSSAPALEENPSSEPALGEKPNSAPALGENPSSELEKKIERIEKLLESINQCKEESEAVNQKDIEHLRLETEDELASEATPEPEAEPAPEATPEPEAEPASEATPELAPELAVPPKKNGGLDIALMEELERAAGGTVEEILVKSMPPSREADEASKQVSKTQYADIDTSFLRDHEVSVEPEMSPEKITGPTEKEPPLVKVETNAEATIKGVIEQILQTEKPVVEPTRTAPVKTFVSRDAAVDKHGNVYTEEMLMNQIG